MKEIWKTIPNYPAYEASNFGNIRSIDRIDCIGRHRKGKNIYLAKTGGGYIQVMISKDRIKKFALAHHLVATAFLGVVGKIGKNSWQINHKDGKKSNNRVENLEWCNASQNHFHAVNIGLKPSGERVHTAKLTKDDVLKIRSQFPTKTLTQLGREFGVTIQNIFRIVHRISWKSI